MSIRTTTIAFVLSLLALLCAGFSSSELNDYRSGLDKLGAGDYQGALIDFSKAIEIDPEEPQSYYYRGLAKAKSETFKDLSVITIKPLN